LDNNGVALATDTLNKTGPAVKPLLVNASPAPFNLDSLSKDELVALLRRAQGDPAKDAGLSNHASCPG